MQLSWKLCSSPCRLPRAGAALEQQPWVHSMAGLGPGPSLCICRRLISPPFFFFLAQNGLENVP